VVFWNAGVPVVTGAVVEGGECSVQNGRDGSWSRIWFM
jgi:hypothetical protein